MRRPHRSIEVFDISLMAVVTKAMGAFLVLMLLLMPYYSSGPIGQQEADDLGKKVDQVQQNIQKAISALSTADAEDLRRRLEEALQQLGEAQKLIAQLQHDNDALNAQVRRLEQDNDTLSQQVAQAQQQVKALQQQNDQIQEELNQLNGDVLSGQALNTDCLNVPMTLGVWTLSSYVTNADKSHSKYVLVRGWSLGDADYQPPSNANDKFNAAAFSYRGVIAGTYMVVLTTRASQVRTLPNGTKVFPLARTPQPCTIQSFFQFTNKKGLQTSTVGQYVIDNNQNPYAQLLAEVVISDKDEWDFRNPSPEGLAWLKDQIAHAEKAQ
jgi:hypothetical protein